MAVVGYPRRNNSGDEAGLVTVASVYAAVEVKSFPRSAMQTPSVTMAF